MELWSAVMLTCVSISPGRFQVADFLSTIFAIHISNLMSPAPVNYLFGFRKPNTYQSCFAIWLGLVETDDKTIGRNMTGLFEPPVRSLGVLLQSIHQIVLWSPKASPDDLGYYISEFSVVAASVRSGEEHKKSSGFLDQEVLGVQGRLDQGLGWMQYHQWPTKLNIGRWKGEIGTEKGNSREGRRTDLTKTPPRL